MDRRGISKETHEFFGVRTAIDAQGHPVSVAYPYPNRSAKVRRLAEKAFYTTGDFSGASGWAKNLFPAGSAKSITITEGEDDAMSVWQMLGKYPVYSIRGASSGLRDVRADYEYLNSFERIYLALDEDEPGRKAAAEIAPVFGYGKIYHVRLAPHKDPHEYLEVGKVKDFKTIWWNATRYMPETVVSDFEEIDREFDKKKNLIRFSWPWASWQRMTGGIEVHRQYIITGLEGTGKTEELHEVIQHLLKTYPDLNLGILHMEEPMVDTIKMQVGKVLKKPIHLDEYAISDDEIKKHYRELFGRKDRVHFFKHFGSEETDVILNTIRFMVAACGCQVVLFDNYQHAVTGRTKDRDTEALDYLANRLESLVKELPFALVAISHENDDEKTRGSRNISKEADVWINVKRDAENSNEHLRNIQYITFKKNRQAGRTGPAGKLFYDQEKATLSEMTDELPT
jgi:twinkle protein